MCSAVCAALVERGIDSPDMIVARSAHAAFHKAAHAFGVEVRSVPVGADWRADVGAKGDARMKHLREVAQAGV